LFIDTVGQYFRNKKEEPLRDSINEKSGPFEDDEAKSSDDNLTSPWQLWKWA